MTSFAIGVLLGFLAGCVVTVFVVAGTVMRKHQRYKRLMNTSVAVYEWIVLIGIPRPTDPTITSWKEAMDDAEVHDD